MKDEAMTPDERAKKPPKGKVPSGAQARLLARLWGGLHSSTVAIAADGRSADPTVSACLRRGWLEPTGASGIWPNGFPYILLTVSFGGVKALALYLDSLQ